MQTHISTLKAIFEDRGKRSLLFREARTEAAAGVLRGSAEASRLVEHAKRVLEANESVPAATYSDYCLFFNTGDRRVFERKYFARRARVSALAVLVLLDEGGPWRDPLQDAVWDICEETTWVLPAHVRGNPHIDLFCSETGFALAELHSLMGDRLEPEVRDRIRNEVTRRILEPFSDPRNDFGWHHGHTNWNAVCNGSVGACFLYLEDHPTRGANALARILASLQLFIAGFGEDGGTTEGTGYWQYGFSRYFYFGELLREATHCEVDILKGEKLRAIAAFPENARLSGACVAGFSDGGMELSLRPGSTARIAGHYKRPGLLCFVSQGPENLFGHFLQDVLRNIFWPRSAPRESAPPTADAWLPSTAVARLRVDDACEDSLVLAAKAGHNGEMHNHNDCGAFVLHKAGDTFIAELGRGLYSRDYFSGRRYENVFTNSYGHSVPRISGRLQPYGAQYAARAAAPVAADGRKEFAIDLARAYDAPGLRSLTRKFILTAEDATETMILEDRFEFQGQGLPVEEAFITWLKPTVTAGAVEIPGDRHALRITSEGAAGTFRCESLEDACRENRREETAYRITFTPDHTATSLALRFRMSVA